MTQTLPGRPVTGTPAVPGTRRGDRPGPRCQARPGPPAAAGSGCAHRAIARVRGTHRLTADLCARHSRMAIDRPRLVREWLLRQPAAAPPAVHPSAAHEGAPGAPGSIAMRLCLPATAASVPVVRDALTRLLGSHCPAGDARSSVLLAVGETVGNAIEHGSAAGATITVDLAVGAGHAVVTVADGGRLGASMPLRPPSAPAPNDERGRGRLVVQELVDRVHVESDGRGTRVTLEFGLAGTAGAVGRGRPLVTSPA